MSIYSETVNVSLPVYSSTAFPVTYYSNVIEFLGSVFKASGVNSIMMYYDLKNLDLKRQGNTAVLYPEELKQEYVGFGNESWGTYSVTADMYIMGTQNSVLERIVGGIHRYVGNFFPVYQMIENDRIVWLKITDEESFQESMRGGLKYRFVFEVRVYIKERGGAYGLT